MALSICGAVASTTTPTKPPLRTLSKMPALAGAIALPKIKPQIKAAAIHFLLFIIIPPVTIF